eukprot:COSAG02_NODE_14851_length_1229_cov_236.079066_2_plen_60_part_01
MPRAFLLQNADKHYKKYKVDRPISHPLRVPLYYTGLKAESAVEVQWVESVLADDGLSVDK